MTCVDRPLRLALPMVLAATVLVGVPALTPTAGAAPPVSRAVLIDADGDGLDDLVDGCPTVASSSSTGCPSASRSVSLKWLTSKHRLQAQVSSPVAGCFRRARISVWRVRSNRDYKVIGGTASHSGRLRVKVARGATYYVTVSASYASGIAECGQAESRKVLAPRS